MHLGEVLVVFADVDVEAPVGHHAAGGDRVVGRVAQRDELVVVIEVREREACHPDDGLQCELAGLVQPGAQAVGVAPVRRAVEAADADVDRVHGAAADDIHQPVPGLLQLQAPLQQLRAVLGHVQAAFVTEEVRRVQQVDVQGVALDPLAAVDEPAQVQDRRGDNGTAGVLDGLARAHLVGDRADPADPRGDVRRLGVPAPAQQRLEEPRRLVDVEPGLGDLAVADDDLQAALALDPGQRLDVDRTAPVAVMVRHGLRPPCGTDLRSR